jgi:hypothetical protein
MSDTKINELYLSDQALGAVMMALQRSLMEQSDITPVLKGFKFVDNDGDLIVLNPPIVKFSHDDIETLESANQEDA